jgi:predicted metal-dependent hydrolase
MSASLDATFRALCRDFFPRWRHSTAWTIVEGPHRQWVDSQGNTHTTTETGYCDSTTKTIFLNYGEHGRQHGRAIIIHEIVHAVTSGAHGKRFCARLRQAAERASDLGDMTS